MTGGHWLRRLVLSVVLLAAVYRTRAVWLGAASVLTGALVLCVLLAPLCAWLERRGLPSGAAALISLLALFLALTMLICLLLPSVLRQSGEAARTISQAARWLSERAQADVRLSRIAARAEGQLTAFAGKLAGGIAQRSIRAGKSCANLLFSAVVALYLLADRRRLFCHALLLLPLDKRQTVLLMLRESANALMAYGSGQVKSSGFVAAATGLGLLLLGVPDALLLSLLMGVLEMIPYIGPALGSVPILLSALSGGPAMALWALGVVLLVQQLEGSFVSPYFTASSTQIPPIAALLCTYVGGSLFGLAGVALAMPLLVAARSAAAAFFRMRAAVSQNNGVESF